MNEKALESILEMASKKLGVPIEKLKSTVEAGSVDELAKNLKKEDKEKLKSIMQNPKLDEQITKNPDIQNMIKKLDD
ncbi:MAG: hypothetical protein GX346_03305 [Clostridiales bacterium]|nr:hypothetical protein [Clostridiales bacterium]